MTDMSVLLALRARVGAGLVPVGGAADRGHRGVRGEAGADEAGGGGAHLVGVRLDAEFADRRQPVVERALVPEAVLRAADAAVAGGDRERGALVRARRRA